VTWKNGERQAGGGGGGGGGGGTHPKTFECIHDDTDEGECIDNDTSVIGK